MSRIFRIALAVALGACPFAAPVHADVYTVVNTDDDGAGSLRWAITQANNHAGPDSVAFNLPGSGVRTIALSSILPSLTAGTQVLGNTQPGYAGTPLVRVDGQDLPANAWGLDTAGAGVGIRGLQIVRFAGPGIRVWNDNVTIRGNYIGNDGSGALGNASMGISCFAGRSLVIGGTGSDDGNVISGNGGDGVSLSQGCDDGILLGNWIGTDAAGSGALPNLGTGVSIAGTNHTLGGAAAGEANVLSGNVWNGVLLYPTATGIQIQGNRIGTDAAGVTALGNGAAGVWVIGPGNQLGAGVAGAGNVVSGNVSQGVLLAAEATGTVLLGNRIGTDLAGSAAIPNGAAGVQIHSSGNTLGGAAPGAGNVISGNGGNGILIFAEAGGNQILGNRIGTNTAGTTALGNAAAGIHLDGTGNTVGGSAAGAGNVVSANGSAGISIGSGATATVVFGNRIGTDVAGAVDLGNGVDGVQIYGAGNFVGGPGAGEGNLISGNGLNGLTISGPGTDGNQVVGNRIGTDAAGATELGNEGYGLRVLSGSGTTVAGNLISGNGRGFSLEFDATGYFVRGNVIGLDATMSEKVPNGGSGLEISSPGHQVGGTGVGEGNVIAGNVYAGIWIDGAGGTGNVFEGNWIGTTPAGATTLGNGQSGIVLTEASGNTIGGTAAGAGNVIAQNDYLGIFVWSGEGNPILGNSIHDNVLLGIDLEPQGPVANDPGDWDLGANRGQNFPVVVDVQDVGGDLLISGFLDAHPLTEYRIELFSNSSFDPTGVGEGEHYLGATTVETDQSGHGAFATNLSGVGGDLFVTATATSPSSDTSEFSPAIEIGTSGPGRFQIWRDLLLSYEGTPGLEVTIVRSHGVQGSATVDVATVDGTASAPDDYGAVATTLAFGPGETMKSVFVPIVTDGIPEADETWRLQLANPTAGATLGDNDDVLAWLFDATLVWPIYTIGSASVVEGDSGTRSLVFTVTLSETDHDVPIEWWTSDGSAVAGEDYIDASGQLLFHPGEGSKTISVPVSGDTTPEEDEVFYVHLYALAQAVVWDGLGDGVILDDDGGAAAPLFLFGDDFEAGTATGWASIVGMP
ncbi:MAG: right-handed parallel beta-helix repeat-containing protein [Holophagales bacterium]|nr:right-handed parallel beta-helix repeat-containing protein [Holophagales bacterium]